MKECRHADVVENKLIFKLPVYLKKPPKENPMAVNFVIAAPDYYVERSYCIECLAETIDRVHNKRWWEFWK